MGRKMKESLSPRLGTCRDCGRMGPIQARGLDPTCYKRHLKKGTVEQFEVQRATRPYAETAEEALLLFGSRTPGEIAEALGMTAAGVAKALYKAGHNKEAAVFDREYKRKHRKSRGNEASDA
jgi:hypothetical protein